jgi:WD40-like Beta Propeller Repeat
LSALGGVCLVVACSSGSDSHGAPISLGGSSSSDAGSAGSRQFPNNTGGGSGGGGAGDDTANAGQAGAAVADGSGGAAGEQPGTIVLVTPGACSEAAMWMGATPLATVSTGNDTLLSITSDELDIVFLRSGAVYRAHRDAPSDSFGAAVLVTIPTGYDATIGVALSSDGKTLVLVSSDGQSFASLSRDSRTVDFGATADPSLFLGLNERSLQTLEHYAAPVLAPDGKSFVFSGFTPGEDGLAVVYESAMASGAWDMPNNISDSLFDGTGSKRSLPTGLSSDSRTLFYFDEATSTEVARFRDRPDAPLYDSVDLGTPTGAMPNAKCDHLYYSSAGSVLTDAD